MDALYSQRDYDYSPKGMIVSRGDGPLTTTSYAILGLLAIQPWTTYELAQQMDRSLGRLWPRAQSKIYEEPKKLVALGLATATPGATGRRPRTVYAITPAGRRALRAWLAQPAAPPSLEWEQLLKVFFADHGTTADLTRTLESIRDWSDDQLDLHIAVGRSYLAGEAPFQKRAAVNQLPGTFLLLFAELVGEWARHALETVAAWPDDPREAQPDYAFMAELLRGAERGRAREALRRPARAAANGAKAGRR